MAGNKKKKVLLSNTIMLYTLTFSTQLLNLVTVPYLTRILGAVIYGKVGLAVSYMTYVQIILDFGFILSATQKAAQYCDNEKYLSELLTSVTLSKLLLSIPVTIVFLGYVLANRNMRGDILFFSLYLAAYILNSFLPDYYYRGIEQMKIITYRSLAIKALFTLLIFVFVKDSTQYRLIPLFTLVGNMCAVLVVLVDMNKRGVFFCRTEKSVILAHFKDSVQFFASRISSTAYQAANTIILSFIYGNSAIIGYYTSADKIVSLAKSGASPIADSLFPYMVKNKDYKIIRKILLITMPLIIVGVIVCIAFSEQICVLLFGSDFKNAGIILNLLMPIVLVILPTYLLAFPIMVPMNLTKYANFSNVFGLCIQTLFLVTLICVHALNVYTLCVATSATEVAVFLFRLAVVQYSRHKINTTLEKRASNE